MLAKELNKAIKEAFSLDEKRVLKNRSKVAKTAKILELDINYTQCKRIAFIYYGLGMLNHLLVKPNETLGDYMERIFVKYKQPYYFTNA